MQNKRVIVLLFSVFLSLCLKATSFLPDREKNLLNDARTYYMNGHFDLAKIKYQELIIINPNSADYTFETGLTYFHSEVESEKALDWFLKAAALDKKNSIPEIHFYCGKSYLYNGNPNEAIIYFKKFLLFLDPEKGKELKAEVERNIQMCENAILLSGNPNKNIEVVNPKTELNSVYAEYAPILMKDESTLIYTARKRGSTGGKKSADAVFYEDIYIALKKDGRWNTAIKLDSLEKHASVPINTSRHNAAVSLNSDETKLFLYKDADLYQSDLISGKWAKPVKMNHHINSREHEPSVFVSPDEKTILFVSNRSGGLGGRDIYISEKDSNGEWAEAKNLGNLINTPFDDDAPFLTDNGNTLYFSSKGHNSIGGFDIFRCVKDADGNWSQPENIGIPINSTADDIYYSESPNGKTKMLSSNRKGTLGKMDIYFVNEIKTPDSVLLAQSETKTKEENAENISETINENSSELNSAKMIFKFHPTANNEYFQQSFGYNQTGDFETKTSFLGFLNHISSIINQKGNVEIIIEASASKVPTTSFGSNQKLAEKRSSDASAKIQKHLIDAGFTSNQFKITVQSKVQGPAYKNDFEMNKAEYEKYQYLKLSAR